LRDGQKTFRALSVVVIADFEAFWGARIADFEAFGVARIADFEAFGVARITDFEAFGVARIADFEALGVARFADDSESKPRSCQNQKDYDAIMSLRHRGEYETKSSGSHPEINDLIDSL
jgi:hypothetical protein